MPFSIEKVSPVITAGSIEHVGTFIIDVNTNTLIVAARIIATTMRMV
jgi:hypothetical protein